MFLRYDPLKHHRHSIRLKGYVYSRAGAYFVTIVSQGRAGLYGEVANGEMALNAGGHMVQRWWLELERKFPTVRTDAHVVMPNHFHGIAVITDAVGADLRVGPDPIQTMLDRVGPGPVAPTADQGAHVGAPLPAVVQWFKTMTTNDYIRGVKTLGWPPFPGKLWQRNYYEHIIRHEGELEDVRRYIANNAMQWMLDEENPARHNGVSGSPEPKGRFG
jgi:putative transposase